MVSWSHFSLGIDRRFTERSRCRSTAPKEALCIKGLFPLRSRGRSIIFPRFSSLTLSRRKSKPERNPFPRTHHHIPPSFRALTCVPALYNEQTDRHEEQPSRITAQPSLPPPVFSLYARLRRGTARGVGVDVVVGVGVGVMPGASHHHRRQRASRPSVASSRQASIKPRAVERVDPPPGIGLLIAISSYDEERSTGFTWFAHVVPTYTSGFAKTSGWQEKERARAWERDRERRKNGARGWIDRDTNGWLTQEWTASA